MFFSRQDLHVDEWSNATWRCCHVLSCSNILQAYTHEAATTRQQDHPTRSRLDRIYCSFQYSHMITTVHIHSQPSVHSDHLPISTTIKLTCPRLRIQQEAQHQRRRNCIPQQFLKSPAYRERYCKEMQEWIHQLLTSNPRFDYSTWLKIKNQIAALAIQLNKEYRAEIQLQIRKNQQDAQITQESVDLQYLHKADAHIMLPPSKRDLKIPGIPGAHYKLTLMKRQPLANKITRPGVV